MVFAGHGFQQEQISARARHIGPDSDVVVRQAESLQKFKELMAEVAEMDPMLVHVEAAGGDRAPWQDGGEPVRPRDLAEHIITHLAPAADERPASHWRGCLLNVGETDPNRAAWLCRRRPGQLSFAAWSADTSPNQQASALEFFYSRFQPHTGPTAFRGAFLDTWDKLGGPPEFFLCDVRLRFAFTGLASAIWLSELWKALVRLQLQAWLQSGIASSGNIGLVQTAEATLITEPEVISPHAMTPEQLKGFEAHFMACLPPHLHGRVAYVKRA